MAKPLPFKAFVTFCNMYPRATEILGIMEPSIGYMHYHAYKRDPREWQRIKFLVKHLSLSLILLREDEQRTYLDGWPIDRHYAALIAQARSDWERSGLFNCPDTDTIRRNYYTNV